MTADALNTSIFIHLINKNRKNHAKMKKNPVVSWLHRWPDYSGAIQQRERLGRLLSADSTAPLLMLQKGLLKHTGVTNTT